VPETEATKAFLELFFPLIDDFRKIRGEPISG
jgi:hypothetical protein